MICPVVDFHVHAFPDDIAARAVRPLADRFGAQPYFHPTLKELQAVRQRNGVERVVIQPVATKPAQVPVINRWAAGLREQPGLVAFGALHPDLPQDAIEEQVNWLRSQGVPGVKLHAEFQDFYPDDDRLSGLYAALERAGLICLQHAGVDLGYPPPVKATPERLRQVHVGFPRLRLVAAHLGGYQQWSEVERHLVGLPIWLDTAYCLQDPLPPLLLEIIRAHGAKRVLFASDSPWGDLSRHLRHLRESPLTPQEITDIAGQNAYNLLGIKSSPADGEPA